MKSAIDRANAAEASSEAERTRKKRGSKTSGRAATDGRQHLENGPAFGYIAVLSNASVSHARLLSFSGAEKSPSG